MKALFIFRASAFLILFCVGSAFAQHSEWRGRIEVIDGVTCARNPGEPMFKGKSISLDNPLRIGLASGNEDELFSQIGAIEVDDDGTIYISDWKESHIKKFDQNGVYIGTIGRKGQGPGEFERINRLQIVGNELWVFDGNRKQFSIFDEKGRYVRSLPLQRISPLDVLIDSRGNYLVKTVRLDPISAEATIAINLYDSGLNLIKTLAADEPRDVLTPFQPYLVWGMMEHAFLLGRNDSYSFGIHYLTGEIQKRISRDYSPVSISPEEKATALKTLQQPGNKEVPSHHPAYGSLLTDHEGHIIVQTNERPANGRGQCHDIFDLDGRYLAQVVFENSPKIWKKNKLYAIGEDEDGFQFLVRYAVRWLIQD